MAKVFVQSDGGGDYTTLAAAVTANETDIEIQETWASAETTNITIDDAGTVIECTGAARHPGYVGGSPSHWRHRITSGHTFTVSADATFIGVDIGSQSTTTSDEIFRINANNVDLIVRDSLLWFNTRNSEQDIYYTNSKTGLTVLLENCIGWNVYRGVIDNYLGEGTFNVNSCHFYNVGYSSTVSTRSGLFGIYDDQSKTNVCNAFNTCIHINTGYVATTVPSGTNTVNIDRCITNVADYTSINWDTENVTDSPVSHTWADADQGAGNYVIVEDITGASPLDLRIQDLGNAKNEAQDMHADGSGANLTMPAQDIVDTVRPQNTNYDCGAFEIAAGGQTYELSASISGASATASPDMNVLRELSASIGL